MRIDHREFAGGGLMAAIGAGFSIASIQGLEIGTTFRMGPGFFPLVLGLLLVVLGGVIMAGSMRLRSEPFGAFPWRAILLTCLGPVLFGLTVRGLGLLPGTALATAAAALASPEVGATRFVLVVAGLTLFCVLVFRVGLGLPVPMIGPWLGGPW